MVLLLYQDEGVVSKQSLSAMEEEYINDLGDSVKKTEGYNPPVMQMLFFN